MRRPDDRDRDQADRVDVRGDHGTDAYGGRRLQAIVRAHPRARSTGMRRMWCRKRSQGYLDISRADSPGLVPSGLAQPNDREFERPLATLAPPSRWIGRSDRLFTAERTVEGNGTRRIAHFQFGPSREGRANRESPSASSPLTNVENVSSGARRLRYRRSNASM